MLFNRDHTRRRGSFCKWMEHSVGVNTPALRKFHFELGNAERPVVCAKCRTRIAHGDTCFVVKKHKALRRFHLTCAKRPAALVGIDASSIVGFGDLDSAAAERARSWLQGCVAVCAAEDPRGALTAPVASSAAPSECEADTGAHSMVVAADQVARPRKKHKDRHVEKRRKQRMWPAFGVDAPVHGQAAIGTIQQTHARNLLTLLQHKLHSSELAAASQILAVLLRDFAHLSTPLAQVTGYSLQLPMRDDRCSSLFIHIVSCLGGAGIVESRSWPTRTLWSPHGTTRSCSPSRVAIRCRIADVAQARWPRWIFRESVQAPCMHARLCMRECSRSR